MKAFIFIVFLALTLQGVHAQELRARVSVITSRVDKTVNKSVFETLKTSLNDFLNNRKWGNDNLKSNEKIDCSFLLNIESTDKQDVYKGSLTLQSARPVFNSSYLSPAINFRDNDVVFKYAEFQQLNFSDTRVSGTDPLAANLTAILAYWVNMILGFDYDSFAPKAGNLYFQKAQNIVNNAPDGSGISGWKAFDGTRNRYWLVENLLNSRYNLMHDVLYGYYRSGLDNMYESEQKGREGILTALNNLNTFNEGNANTMILPFFFQAKAQELANIFSDAPPQEKKRALNILEKVDVPNLNMYKEKLQ